MHGPEAAVDVLSVRLVADDDDLGPQFLQDGWRHAVGGAVGAVDHDGDAFQGQVPRERVLGVDDVAPGGVVDPVRLADAGGSRPQVVQLVVRDQVLDLGLDLIGQLEAVGAEELDPVVLIGIVRRADHRPGVGAHRDRQVGDGGRRQRAAEQHVDSHAAEPGSERRLQHVAGEPRVLADHHPMAMVAALDLMGDGPAELEHQLAGHRVHVGRAADSVGPEQLARRLYRFLCQADGHVECS